MLPWVGESHLSSALTKNFIWFRRVVRVLQTCECQPVRPYSKMDREQFRTLIKHHRLRKFSATQVKVEFHGIYWSSSPSFSTISFWISEFKRGRTSINDEPRSGRPKTETTEENVKKVYEMVVADRRIKVRQIAEALMIIGNGCISFCTKICIWNFFRKVAAANARIRPKSPSNGIRALLFEWSTRVGISLD